MTERSPLADYPKAQIVSGLIVWGIIVFVGTGLAFNWRAAIGAGFLWVFVSRFVLRRHRKASE
jgi:hypothetical protein